jgi:hypothetical protein
MMQNLRFIKKGKLKLILNSVTKNDDDNNLQVKVHYGDQKESTVVKYPGNKNVYTFNETFEFNDMIGTFPLIFHLLDIDHMNNVYSENHVKFDKFNNYLDCGKKDWVIPYNSRYRRGVSGEIKISLEFIPDQNGYIIIVGVLFILFFILFLTFQIPSMIYNKDNTTENETTIEDETTTEDESTTEILKKSSIEDTIIFIIVFLLISLLIYISLFKNV